MKRLVIGICVLSVLLVVGITITAGFQIAHQPTTSLLQDASDAAMRENWEEAVDCAQKAQERWERYWRFTAAFADHAPMDEIDSLFAQLEVRSAEKSREHFPALCAELSRLTEAIAESHRLRWWTLL